MAKGKTIDIATREKILRLLNGGLTQETVGYRFGISERVVAKIASKAREAAHAGL